MAFQPCVPASFGHKAVGNILLLRQTFIKVYPHKQLTDQTLLTCLPQRVISISLPALATEQENYHISA